MARSPSELPKFQAAIWAIVEYPAKLLASKTAGAKGGLFPGYAALPRNDAMGPVIPTDWVRLLLEHFPLRMKRWRHNLRGRGNWRIPAG
jgi:hypothetical protein